MTLPAPAADAAHDAETAAETPAEADAPLWTPSRARVDASLLTPFAQTFAPDVAIGDYAALWRRSVTRREDFWAAVWADGGLVGEPGDTVLGRDGLPGAEWFPKARLNFAENLLKPFPAQEAQGRPALVTWTEAGPGRQLSRADLRADVLRVAAGLLADGVRAGDRVAGFVANGAEAGVAMLATARLGAVWSSCSPDFGVDGVLDRFGQIAPRVLFFSARYRYANKDLDTLPRLGALVAGLPELRRVVLIGADGARPLLATDATVAATAWDAYGTDAPALAAAFPRHHFAHPLYVMFSSGTTGRPKCIVHGIGGTLLQQVKELRLQSDVKPGDCLFFYTTTGWMMWNWLVAGLAVGATLVLYDGSPFHPGPGVLWEMARATGVTHFGCSPKYLAALDKAGFAPKDHHALPSLGTLFSTGSPLAPEQFDWVYAAVRADKDLHLASISGGTDIVSCFALGNPWSPVYRGEIQGPGLGMAVSVFDDDGTPSGLGAGELVCVESFPSQPTGFWDDPDQRRYRAAYFERFPGVWHHGDFARLTEHGGLIITGRSDATLNPGGVRIGTAEIYRVVEALPEVLEALAVGREVFRDVEVWLFVRLRDGQSLTPALVERIRGTVRTRLTPRHVPARVLDVPDLPRTKSGKITELAVREVIHGREVKNQGALANPEALVHFAGLAGAGA